MHVSKALLGSLFDYKVSWLACQIVLCCVSDVFLEM